MNVNNTYVQVPARTDETKVIPPKTKDRKLLPVVELQCKVCPEGGTGGKIMSGCAALASSLRSNPAHLRVLDLTRNDLQDRSVQLLSEFLAEPLCRLETLNLRCCTLTLTSCQCLTSVLRHSSALKELDLSYNRLTDQGVELLSDWLGNHQCRLEILR
ncbi:hypothetical protein PAMP_021606 [Pampus punctatissimus]